LVITAAEVDLLNPFRPVLLWSTAEEEEPKEGNGKHPVCAFEEEPIAGLAAVAALPLTAL
jgi:hypothetical protein